MSSTGHSRSYHAQGQLPPSTFARTSAPAQSFEPAAHSAPASQAAPYNRYVVGAPSSLQPFRAEAVISQPPTQSAGSVAVKAAAPPAAYGAAPPAAYGSAAPAAHGASAAAYYQPAQVAQPAHIAHVAEPAPREQLDVELRPKVPIDVAEELAREPVSTKVTKASLEEFAREMNIELPKGSTRMQMIDDIRQALASEDETFVVQPVATRRGRSAAAPAPAAIAAPAPAPAAKRGGKAGAEPLTVGEIDRLTELMYANVKILTTAELCLLLRWKGVTGYSKLAKPDLINLVLTSYGREPLAAEDLPAKRPAPAAGIRRAGPTKAQIIEELRQLSWVNPTAKKAESLTRDELIAHLDALKLNDAEPAPAEF